MLAPFDLERFVRAQERRAIYDEALFELESGRKESHWMWFIFPQMSGLGRSEESSTYGISGAEEARAYLNHATLGPRLEACAAAILRHTDRSAVEILGPTDAKKLRSCATLFCQVSPPDSVFHQVLERFFDGEPDGRTLAMLR